jgi:PAS domain S-box-containing protein
MRTSDRGSIDPDDTTSRTSWGNLLLGTRCVALLASALRLIVNPAAAQMEGSTPEEINGKSAEEIYPPEQAAAYYADDLEVIESGEPKLNIIEKHVSTERNEEMWAQVGKVPVRDRSGDIVGITVFAVDITDAKRAEEALQAAHSELEQKNQQLERAQEVFRSTLEQISEVVERSADAVELRRYLRDAREEFDRL